MSILVEIEDLDKYDNLLFVDTRLKDDYARGHIPGAIHCDTFSYCSEDTTADGLGKVLRDWQEMFAAVGISLIDTVVFYDVGTENRCARPAVMLAAMGHPSVHVLHGGMSAWIGNGGKVSVESEFRLGNAAQALKIRKSLDFMERVVGIQEVGDAVMSGKAYLLDVRPPAEFSGKLCVQNNPRVGHIPGAHSMEWTRLIEMREIYPAVAGTARNHPVLCERFRPWKDVQSELALVGLTDLHKRVIVYCQKSHRASNTFLALDRLGFVNARIYIGSFREWSRCFEWPIEMAAARSK